jgi:hypothetical protein
LRKLRLPLTSYQLFTRDEKPKLLGTIEQKAVALSIMWSELDDSERMSHHAATAARAKNEHLAEAARLKALLKLCDVGTSI